MWTGVKIGFVFILAVAVLAGCVEERLSQPTPGKTSTLSTPESITTSTPAPLPIPTPHTAPGQPIPLIINISTSKSFYMPSEEARIEIIFENVGSKPIAIRPFPPEIRIVHYTPFRIVKSFSPGNKELKLTSGESFAYLLSWNQKDENGNRVNPGHYHLEVRNFTVESTDGGWRVDAMSSGRVLIQHPQGAMEKKITVNESQTVNNVTVTLDRVNLTATGGEIRVLLQTPEIRVSDITPPQPTPTSEPTPPPEIFPISAYYMVDDEKLIPYSPGFKWVDDEKIMISWQIDPVPADAREMILVITGIGEYSGLWKFTIPLDKNKDGGGK